jgi:hypothetical protein
MWKKTGTEFNSQVGLNVWRKITINIPPTMRTNSFKYRFVGNMAAGVCGNQYIYFDDITINSSLGVLPVNIDFNAQARQGVNELQWTNFNEGGNLQYEVERSADGRNFSTIASVAARPVTGNASYSYTDLMPLANMNYYRLAVISRNGEKEYSSVKVVTNRTSGAAISLFPNPVVDMAHIQVPAGWQQQGLQVRVIGNDGRIYRSERKQKAAATELVDLKSLPAGAYRLVLTGAENQELQQLAFVKK